MSFKQKLALAFGAASLILICIGVITFRRMAREDDDEKWVTHTQLVAEKLDGLFADLLDAQTASGAF